MIVDIISVKYWQTKETWAQMTATDAANGLWKMGSPKAGARAFVVGSKVLAQKKAEFGVACVLSDNQTPGILSSFHHASFQLEGQLPTRRGNESERA